jgi:hypothetical protein
VSVEDKISRSSLCEEYRRIAYMYAAISITLLASSGGSSKRGEHCVAV